MVSDKRAKTVTVLVERRVKHELYDKIVAKSSKYHAHDEKGEYKTGDVVEITESRPLSKTKNWVATRLVQKPPWCDPHCAACSAECKSDRQFGRFFFFRACFARAFQPRPPGQHNEEQSMIKVGEKIPAATLMEYSEVEGNGCSIGPNAVDTLKASAGKTIAVFALPGAFTPTCSAKHVPGYVQHAADFKAAGVDEIWCLSVNDAFVMGAWARDQKTGDKVRMLADGSADFAKATGLTLDLTGRGMGLRSNRYSMLIKDGVVKSLNIEAPGKFEVSDADTLLAQAKAGA